jgi:NTE family protein
MMLLYGIIYIASQYTELEMGNTGTPETRRFAAEKERRPRQKAANVGNNFLQRVRSSWFGNAANRHARIKALRTRAANAFDLGLGLANVRKVIGAIGYAGWLKDSCKSALRFDPGGWLSWARRRQFGATRSSRPAKTLALALQGGGAHGALTWGIVDRLLEDDRLSLEALSGTSAGALNAAALASGFLDGGREGARAALSRFWRDVALLASFSPLKRTFLERLADGWNADHAAATVALDLFTRVLSPYQFNPLALNPLRDLLVSSIDFERLRRESPIKLFVSATIVKTGKTRVFTTAELNAEVLLASACLPSLHHAVEIDGEHYWDGGFTANPPILPMAVECRSADLVIVQITPAAEHTLPVTAREIHGRLNRIILNAPLNRELQSLALIRGLAAEGGILGPLARRLSRIHIHHIDAEDATRPLGHASALSPEWGLVSYLHDQGRACAEKWLERHFDDIGKASTADLEHEFF